MVENWMRFDFVEVVVFEVEVIEFFEAVIGTGMSKLSSRSSGRSRCS